MEKKELDKGKQKAEGWQQKGMEREAPNSIGLTLSIISGQITEISGSNSVDVHVLQAAWCCVILWGIRENMSVACGLFEKKGQRRAFDGPLYRIKRKEVQSPHAR